MVLSYSFGIEKRSFTDKDIGTVGEVKVDVLPVGDRRRVGPVGWEER